MVGISSVQNGSITPDGVSRELDSLLHSGGKKYVERVTVELVQNTIEIEG